MIRKGYDYGLEVKHNNALKLYVYVNCVNVPSYWVLRTTFIWTVISYSVRFINAMKTEILKLHSRMKELTLQSGVNQKHYDSVIAELDDYTDEELSKLYDWLN